MHKYYIELTLLPEGEVDLRYLWEQVYTKLHLALSSFAHDNNGRNTLGCSFPRYDVTQFTLGHKLRVFGYTKAELSGLRLDSLLTDVLDYVHITSVKEVPANSALVCFGSVKRRTSTSISKLARRRVKRSELQGSPVTYAEALKGYEGQDISKNTSLPFVKLVSNSTGCPFRLTIKKQKTTQESSGCFNSFGLSTTTTVPDF